MKTALMIGAIVLGGSAVGLAVERTGFYSPIDEPGVSVGLHEAPFYPCPGDDAVGFFHGGDRVLATGRSTDGGWLEVRAPFDITTRVWLEAEFATPDSDLGTLPVIECEELAIVTAPASTTTSTSTTAATTTTVQATTSTAGDTTTTVLATPSTAGDTTTTVLATTSTVGDTTAGTWVPADQEGPNVGFFNSFPGELWEDNVVCQAQQRTVLVSAIVADPSGISSVQLAISVGTTSGTAFMVEGPPAVYSVTVGPFPDTTLSGSDAQVQLQLTAFDAFSNSTILSSNTLILLHDCTIE